MTQDAREDTPRQEQAGAAAEAEAGQAAGETAADDAGQAAESAQEAADAAGAKSAGATARRAASSRKQAAGRSDDEAPGPGTGGTADEDVAADAGTGEAKPARRRTAARSAAGAPEAADKPAATDEQAARDESAAADKTAADKPAVRAGRGAKAPAGDATAADEAADEPAAGKSGAGKAGDSKAAGGKASAAKAGAAKAGTPKADATAANGGSPAAMADLPGDIFDATVNVPLIHQVVVAQQAAARQGTHATKTRGDVRGGGRKPYRQKGTGRARQGSSRAPQFAGGGVVHGPVPRSYAQKTPKKMKAAALRGALSDRARHGLVYVVDAFVDGDEPKTGEALAALAAATGVTPESSPMLVVAKSSDKVTWKSLRNAPGVHLIDPGQLNTYDVLVSDRVVFTTTALESFVARAGAGAREGEER
jgi:large subunit ribosomal protein L4